MYPKTIAQESTGSHAINALRRLATLYGPLAVVILTIALFALEAGRPVPQLDDAFISYRYALNFAQGHGLVFNIGEYVEGYTNLLWTLLIAGGLWLHLSDPETLSRILSTVFGSACLFVTYRYARGLLPRPMGWAAALLPPVMLMSPGFIHWHTSGLETPLYVLLVVSSCWASTTDRRWWVLAGCILATLTRPDGVLLAGCLMATPALFELVVARHSSPRALARIAAPSVCYALFLAAITLWRIALYHDPFPNTFAAKVGQVGWYRGLIYLLSFLGDGPILLIPGAVAAWFTTPKLRHSLLFVWLNAFYVVQIGGDVFVSGRFLLPSFPILLVANLVAATSAGRRSRAGAILLAAPILCGFWSLCAPFPRWSFDVAYIPPTDRPGWFDGRKRENAFIHIFPGEDDRKMIARLTAMRQSVAAFRSLATIEVGRLGYFAMDIRILDLVGLLDRHIARSKIAMAGALIIPGHTRTDASYILEKKPDMIDIPAPAGYIVPGASMPVVPIPKPGIVNLTGIVHLPCVMELWHNPNLQAAYIFHPELNAWVRSARQ